MSMNLVTLLYLIASVCFIQALKGLSHPTTSIRGNLFGMTGMAIAVLTTAALIVELAGGQALGLGYVLAGLVVGGGAGAIMAQRVEMTKMPELVAFMHSMIGLAAVCIAVAVVAEPWAFGIVVKGAAIPGGNRVELALGAFIGAVTFSGSVIAFGKLSGKYKFRLFQGAPVVFTGQHKLNLVLGLATLFFIFGFWHSQSWIDIVLVIALGFGACQDSCRLIHAADGCLSESRECVWMIESRAGLRVTGPMGDQLRVLPDQRAGLA